VVVTVNTLPTTNLTVSASQTIDASNLSYNTITITSTGYLTITTSNNTSCLIGTMIDVQSGGRLQLSEAQLKFLPSAKIRIRQGGRALIVGGLLTSNCPGTLWHGIEVLGNSNNSHEAVQESMVTFGVDTDGNSNQGGLRIIKNATIEFAQIGVRLFTGTFSLFSPSSQSGGYITADQAIFRNNNRDIAGSTFNIYPNMSNLRRVKFEINNSTLDNNNSIKPRVELFSSRGIKFEGCTWSNTNTTFLNANTQQVQNVTGILLRSSSCEVKEFTNGSNIQTSNFEGFIYGFRNLGITLDDMLIQNCIFRCYRGIYGVNWAEQSQVLKCRFENLNQAAEIGLEIPSAFINSNSGTIWNNSTTNSAGMTISSGPAYGLYLDASSNTDIRLNNFEILSTTESNQRVGCYINNCSASLIRIKDNYFRGNTYGIRFFNINRNTLESNVGGTTFECNIFSENRRHVEIRSASVQLNAGINSNIYSNLSTSFSNQFYNNANPYFSSGRYIQSINTGLHNFMSTANEINGVTDQINIGGTVFYGLNTANSSCGQENFLPNRVLLAQSALNKKEEYYSYKDNGNQTYYAQQIEGITINNLLSRYNELMSISPALSPENIIEVLDKELDIPRTMILSILLSNVSSLKNGDVLSKIEELSDPLTIWERDSIYSALHSIDEKELLQIEFNQVISAYQFKLFEDYLAIRNDSTILYKDSLLSVLKQESREFSPLRSDLIKAMNQLDWIQAQNVITDWLPQIKEDTHEHKDLILLSSLINDAGITNLQIDSNSTSYNGFARDYFHKEYPLTYRCATIITGVYDSIPFHGDLDYDSLSVGLRSINSPSSLQKTPKRLTIFPNPAKDVVRLSAIEIDLDSFKIQCFDISGKLCDFKIITKSRSELVLDVNELSNGFYIFEISNNQELISIPLTISR
jgi:hypothetical protein